VCTQTVFPGAEVCDAIDNNCDGIVDSFDEVCYSKCEAGVKHCFGGVWDDCSALIPVACTNYGNCQVEEMCVEVCPAAPQELCNGLDDNCNGSPDETFTCTLGQQQEEACGNCGTRIRTCTDSCIWSGWGSCNGQGLCSPGQNENRSCGNCGTHSRTCAGNCYWGSWGSCTGQGECSAGSKTTSGCANSCQAKTCSGSCEWPDACTECNGCSTSYKCGLGCSFGYHPESYSYSGSCGSCCNNNRTKCVKN